MVAISLDGGNLYLNNIPLTEILQIVYQQGKRDALTEDINEKVTFIQLSKELAEQGRKLSVKTLTNRAREAKVKVFPFDGKRLAVFRRDVKNFIGI